MKNKLTFSIFGAGASGLYTAWRLLDGKPSKSKKDRDKLLKRGDTLQLFDWGNYDFIKRTKGTRAPGARVCTWHYNNDKKASYLELGGMRYSFWDGKPSSEGHRLVTTTIEKLGLDKISVPFNESSDPLMSLRTRNSYISEVNSNSPAPYDADNYNNAMPPDDGFTVIQSVAITETEGPQTRLEWAKFYDEGVITKTMPESSVYQKGDRLKDVGYWNLGYDMLGQEGFSYLADGNGYSSNVVNSNSAQSFNVNDEFTPGTEYKTLTHGFSSMFESLFKAIRKLAREKGVKFDYHFDTRLRSIVYKKDGVHFTTAKREAPDKKAGESVCDAAFMAMPRSAIELVAQATRFEHEGIDVLNHKKVQLYLESVLMEHSYKIGMFFDYPWWTNSLPKPKNYTGVYPCPYPAKLDSWDLTQDDVTALEEGGFPTEYLNEITAKGAGILNTPYDSKDDFVNAVEQCIGQRLSLKEEDQISTAAELNTIGPSITDMPIRQVVYFGDNALVKRKKKVYGILASYDDIYYTTFWKALELGPKAERKIPESRDIQPLIGPRKAPDVMVKMLRKQLAALHFGPQADVTAVPEPLETRYMDWGLPPFGAGYHAYKSHYNMGDVQNMIRKPSQLIPRTDAPIYIVGETYSNDQAWVEGAYCTAESVLNTWFGIEPIISEKNYPFIIPAKDK